MKSLDISIDSSIGNKSSDLYELRLKLLGCATERIAIGNLIDEDGHGSACARATLASLGELRAVAPRTSKFSPM